jgi:hypothetical protein
MSDYTRITRKCLVSHLHPELRKAIRDYSPSQAVGNEAETHSLTAETHSLTAETISLTAETISLTAETHSLTAETISCYETTSERKSAGILTSWLNGRSDTITHVGILLTPERLIWVRWGDQSGALLTAANLKEIRVKVYASVLANDTGLEVYGFIGDSKSRVRGYIGMESASIAQEFCDEIRQAIDKVNPPVKRKILGFLGR